MRRTIRERYRIPPGCLRPYGVATRTGRTLRNKIQKKTGVNARALQPFRAEYDFGLLTICQALQFFRTKRGSHQRKTLKARQRISRVARREIRFHLRGQNIISLRDRLPMAVLLFSRPNVRIVQIYIRRSRTSC